MSTERLYNLVQMTCLSTAVALGAAGLVVFMPSFEEMGQAISWTPPLAQAQTASATAPANPAKPAAAAENTAAQQAPLIDPASLTILVRSTMLAVQHANDTGNYTVLRDLGAPGFQAANSAAKLADIFASIRNQRVDLSALALLEPKFPQSPQQDANGMMRVNGFFPSTPLQVNFELIYAPVESRWRLFGIALNVSPSTTASNTSEDRKQPPSSQTPPARQGSPAPQPQRP